MKTLKEFLEDATTVGSVAGLTGEPPVHLKKKKKEDIAVLKRFIEKQEDSKQKWSR
jgi:hypothetical protein|tara:strand:- start:421 stop:588 length:168 start_codon:yes stop_codon:yes gene_type:complete